MYILKSKYIVIINSLTLKHTSYQTQFKKAMRDRYVTGWQCCHLFPIPFSPMIQNHLRIKNKLPVATMSPMFTSSMSA